MITNLVNGRTLNHDELAHLPSPPPHYRIWLDPCFTNKFSSLFRPLIVTALKKWVIFFCRMSLVFNFLVDMCRDSIAELEIGPLLLQSLQLCFASPKFKTQCLITLAACIEGCGKVSFIL